MGATGLFDGIGMSAISTFGIASVTKSGVEELEDGPKAVDFG